LFIKVFKHHLTLPVVALLGTRKKPGSPFRIGYSYSKFHQRFKGQGPTSFLVVKQSIGPSVGEGATTIQSKASLPLKLSTTIRYKYKPLLQKEN
jgi:hypothetical protein